jgi:hypothetical protein
MPSVKLPSIRGGQPAQVTAVPPAGRTHLVHGNGVRSNLRLHEIQSCSSRLHDEVESRSRWKVEKRGRFTESGGPADSRCAWLTTPTGSSRVPARSIRTRGELRRELASLHHD